MRAIRFAMIFTYWILRACHPFDPQNHWTWSDCRRHAKNQHDRNVSRSLVGYEDKFKQWFPKTEKDSLELQRYLMQNGWTRIGSKNCKQVPIPGIGDCTNRYLEFDLDQHTFTWDNFLIDWRNKTIEQITAELPVLVTEFEP